MASRSVRASDIRIAEMVLVFLEGPYRGQEIAFGSDSIALGKAPQNDVPLSDTTVSRRHAEIRRERRGCVLRDLGSTNGTFLDGAEIREAYLRSGSQVTLGKTRFRFRLLTRTVPAPPLEPGEHWEGLEARSEALRTALGRARALAPLADTTVILQGPRGAGRSRLAEAIHRAGPLADAPLTWVDCSREPPGLLEQRLFEPRTGVTAAGGSIVLAEPWDLPCALQRQLADAIRGRRCLARSRLGVRIAPSPQRYVVVTSRDLGQERERERLVEDLWEVLDRPVVHVTPLHERPEDVDLRLASFVEQRVSSQDEAGSLLTELGSLFRELPWPGNEAELEGVLGALATRLEAGAARDGIRAVAVPHFDAARSFGENKAAWVAAFERAYLAWLMERHGGNVSRAARAADMDRKHLHRLLRRYGLR